MAPTMRMAVVFMMASAVAQANQCSSGGECPRDDEPKSVVSLIQTKLQTNVEEEPSGLVSSIGSFFSHMFTTQPASTFSYIRFTPTKLRMASSDTVQLMEIAFANGESQLDLSTATITNPGGNSPEGEGPDKVIDESTNTKWVDYNWRPDTGLLFFFPTAVSVDRFSFTTANNLPNHDPVSWKVELSVDGLTYITVQQEDDYALSPHRLTQTPWFPFAVDAAGAAAEATTPAPTVAPDTTQAAVVSTTLTTAVAAGSTTLHVANYHGFKVGQELDIGPTTPGTPAHQHESVDITAMEIQNTGTEAIPVLSAAISTTPLQFDHPVGAQVVAEAFWERCACEHEEHSGLFDCSLSQTCLCNGAVRYGHGDDWATKDATEVAGSIQCNNDIFGDPIFGMPKECQCARAMRTTP